MRLGSISIFSSPPFFSSLDRTQPETLQWRRGYLSVPVRHSIRTDGSSVIKMALRYNREDEDARERALASVFAVGARRFRRVMNARSLAHPLDGNVALITFTLIPILGCNAIDRNNRRTKRILTRRTIVSPFLAISSFVSSRITALPLSLSLSLSLSFSQFPSFPSHLMHFFRSIRLLA